MSYRGDISLGDTIDIKFTTRNASGVPTTLAGSPVISAYIGNSTTEITAGITLTADFDSRTGLNNVRVVASSGNGFTTGTNIDLIITTGTVNSVSVVGEVIGSFSIEARQTNVRFWNGTAVATPSTAGIPEVNIKNINNQAVSASGGITFPASTLASTATVPTATQNADALLNRDMSAVAVTNARSPINALRFLRNYWFITGGTLTVMAEDDATPAWTGAVTMDAAAIPITGMNPA